MSGFSDVLTWRPSIPVKRHMISSDYSGQRKLLLYFRNDGTDRPRSDSARQDSSTDTKSRSRLLDLPWELREHIYLSLLSELCHEILHPWDDITGFADFVIFESYVNLQLTSRQVSEEVKMLFDRDIRERLTFFTTDISTLFSIRELQRRSQGYPLLHENVRFMLRATAAPRSRVKKRPTEKNIGDDIVSFFRGFLEEWDALPRAYSIHGLRFNGHSDPDYDPFDNGFERKVHHKCCAQDEMCTDYQEIKYPPLEHSISLRTFTWRRHMNGSSDNGLLTTMKCGCLIIEGKLRDFDLDGYRQKICDELESTRLPSEDEGLDYDETSESEFVLIGDRW